MKRTKYIMTALLLSAATSHMVMGSGGSGVPPTTPEEYRREYLAAVNELAKRRVNIEESNKAISELTDIKLRLEAEKKISEEEKLNLKKQITNKIDAIKHLGEDLSTVKEKVKNLEEKLENNKCNNKQLVQEKNLLIEEISSLKQSLEQVNMSNAEMLEALNLKLLTLSKEYDKTKKNYDEVCDLNVNLAGENDVLSKENRSLTNKFAETKVKNHQLEQQCQSRDQVIKKLFTFGDAVLEAVRSESDQKSNKDIIQRMALDFENLKKKSEQCFNIKFNEVKNRGSSYSAESENAQTQEIKQDRNNQQKQRVSFYKEQSNQLNRRSSFPSSQQLLNEGQNSTEDGIGLPFASILKKQKNIINQYSAKDGSNRSTPESLLKSSQNTNNTSSSSPLSRSSSNGNPSGPSNRTTFESDTLIMDKEPEIIQTQEQQLGAFISDLGLDANRFLRILKDKTLYGPFIQRIKNHLKAYQIESDVSEQDAIKLVFSTLTYSKLNKNDIAELYIRGLSRKSLEALNAMGGPYAELVLRLFEPFDYLKEEATIGANPYNVNQIISHKDAKEVLDAIFNIYEKANKHKVKVREGYEAFNEIGYILTHTVDDFSIQQLIEKSKTFK